nr:retrovirus-related Pol polyprotein from transposon TNT 1-94 [Tanacetum cinerariifolium]
MMGELNFFVGLQIKQMEDGILFNQAKYIKEMLKKFGLEDSKPMNTPMSSDTKITKDEECESVDSTRYRGMISCLLYLTASRPDIMFSVCLCARFQEVPKTSHLEVVKHIFRYIKGTTYLGLWYPKGTGIETIVYDDSDHAGDYVYRNNTSGICTFVGCCLTSWFSKKQTALAISTTKAEYVSAEKKGHISIEKVPSVDNIADILTKPLKRGHRDHVSACLFHMLYCIESLTLYNLAFFILKRMEKTRNKPKELLPFGMLLSRLFKHVVYVFSELAIDKYLLFDHVMHPFAPHYERKIRSDHGKKRPHESNASSSSTTQDYHFSSLPPDAMIDENDDESSHPNSSSLSQQVFSSSTVVSRVCQNPSHESHILDTFLYETINLQTQQRDAH